VVRKHTSPQKIEPSATVHLTLDGFQAVDLPLNLTVAPIRFDGCGDGSDVLLQAVAESY